MGSRGPQPEPTALRVLKGEKPLAGEPIPATKKVEPPSWLEGWALETWKELAPDMISKGVLTHWDVPLFARLCWLEGATREQMAEIDVEGLMLGRVKNPRCQVLRDMSTELRSIATHFGMTPASRRNLASKEDDAKKGSDLLTA